MAWFVLVVEVLLFRVWFDETAVLAIVELLATAPGDAEVEAAAPGDDPSIIMISLVVVSGIAFEFDAVLLAEAADIEGEPLLLEVSSFAEGCGAPEVLIFEY